ncbi:putative protein UPSTREAM OF FLC [Cocos nucifera]|uniref:SOSEKI DIX-like domain-containing protein n=1 Tax=Cocos nucifera TaxID=13894 RepID=A0A8K0I298_COCNU|nr:putative protein UPSTREAM OF FLC [Cocos nucifera]
MPSLFSWSCKRSYKNGYVWNDLAENDIIYPADGAEYVLKGSEIIQACSERFQHVKITNRQPKPLQISHNRHQIEVEEEEEGIEEEEEREQDVIEEEVVDKFGKVTASGVYTTRCSRGISTDEIERVEKPMKTRDQPTELSLDDASPPSSSSSDKAPATHRFEDGDPAGEPGQTRNSVLLQLIACGSVSVKGRAAGGGGGGSSGGGLLKAAVSSAAAAAAGASSLASGRRGGASNKGSVSRFASRAGDEDELRCVSENPRFGHPPLEEKEYFSGSIVEGSRGPPGPSLKKSNSYNEER